MDSQEIMRKNLLILLNKNAMSQTELQNKLFINNNDRADKISKVINGKRKLNNDEVFNICKIFNIDENDFKTKLLDVYAETDNTNLVIEEKPLQLDSYVEIKRKVFNEDNKVFIVLISIVYLLFIISIIMNICGNNYIGLYVIAFFILLFYFGHMVVSNRINNDNNKEILLVNRKKEIYYSNNYKRNPIIYSILCVVDFFLGMFIFMTSCINVYNTDVLFYPLFIMFLLLINFYSIIVMIIPKTKMVKKIDYTLYYTESIRRFSVLFLILCVSYFLTFTDFDITTVFVSIILLPFIIVSSEYKNQKIIRFYNSYKMNE